MYRLIASHQMQRVILRFKNRAHLKVQPKKRSMMTLVLCGFVIIMYGCIFSEDVLNPVSADGGKWGYINRKGEYVINPQFEDADFFSDGLAKIRTRDGKTGYINKKGEYVIPATYKNGTAFSDGLAFVVSDGGFPICIDRNGNQKFALNDANRITAFREGMAVFITESGERGFVDKTGRTVINAQFESAYSFRGGFARIWRDGVAGFIDKTGKITINPQFKAVGNFYEDKAAFSDGKQWGYISTKGGYAINPMFDDAGRFSNGLAAVKQGKAFGYIDKTGKLVINPQFDGASPFSDGLAAVRAGGKYGYINKDGKYEINTQFEYAGDFSNGTALVCSADKWGFINKKGQYVVNPQYKYIKIDPSIDARPEFVESDYYDASEFIKLFFEKEAGNTFDGIKASTTLEELSDHPVYGAGINARESNYADYRKIIPITKDISIEKVLFIFVKTPVYKTVETSNNWGYRSARKEYDFNATPDAIVYQFILSGKASEKRDAVVNALKTEIERRHRQSMLSDADRGSNYTLYQDDGKLNFRIDASSNVLLLWVAYNKEGLNFR